MLDLAPVAGAAMGRHVLAPSWGGEWKLDFFSVVGGTGDEGGGAAVAALCRGMELRQWSCVYTHIHTWECHAAPLRARASHQPFSAGPAEPSLRRFGRAGFFFIANFDLLPEPVKIARNHHGFLLWVLFSKTLSKSK